MPKTSTWQCLNLLQSKINVKVNVISTNAGDALFISGLLYFFLGLYASTQSLFSRLLPATVLAEFGFT
jgi:hypothetical protein